MPEELFLQQIKFISERNNIGLIDIIFVHGLEGDWWKTWNAAEENNRYWPKWLIQDILSINVWSLKYPAPLTNWTAKNNVGMTTEERARSIIQLLLNRDIGSRPIVFIAHSLGGLMVKQILRLSKELGMSEWKAIFSQTKAVIFIATPHDGAGIVDLGKFFLSNIGSFNINKMIKLSDTVEEMRRDNPPLLALGQWYSQNAVNFNIKTKAFYEKAPLFGVATVVSPSSANPGVFNCIPIPVDGDHISIAKPESRASLVYETAKTVIEDIITNLPSEEFISDNNDTVRRNVKKPLRYYKYISKTRVEAITPENWFTEYSAKHGISLDIFNAERITEIAPGLILPYQVEAVEEFLKEEGFIGTLDDPLDWFSGELDMFWSPTLIQQIDDKAAIFATIEGTTAIVLVGSHKHLRGNYALVEQPSMSDLPQIFNLFRDQILNSDQRNQLTASPSENRRQYLEHAVSIAQGNWGGVRDRFEFVAEIHMIEEILVNNVNFRVIIGSPLFMRGKYKRRSA